MRNSAGLPSLVCLFLFSTTWSNQSPLPIAHPENRLHCPSICQIDSLIAGWEAVHRTIASLEDQRGRALWVHRRHVVPVLSNDVKSGDTPLSIYYRRYGRWHPAYAYLAGHVTEVALVLRRHVAATGKEGHECQDRGASTGNSYPSIDGRVSSSGRRRRWRASWRRRRRRGRCLKVTSPPLLLRLGVRSDARPPDLVSSSQDVRSSHPEGGRGHPHVYRADVLVHYFVTLSTPVTGLAPLCKRSSVDFTLKRMSLNERSSYRSDHR